MVAPSLVAMSLVPPPDFIELLDDGFGFVHCDEGHAVFFEIVEAFKIIAVMPAHLKHTEFFSFPFD